jgi:hypothetical protein
MERFWCGAAQRGTNDKKIPTSIGIGGIFYILSFWVAIIYAENFVDAGGRLSITFLAPGCRF